MQSKKLNLNNNFKIILGNQHSQAAEMVIKPGGSEGSLQNNHAGSDQWMHVISGKGEAIINKKRIRLFPQSLVLIERGENHQIRNTGKTPLKTLNFYVPPAYTMSGNELPTGKSK